MLDRGTAWEVSFLRRGKEREVLTSASWSPMAGLEGTAQNCTRGGSDWALGKESLP